MIVLTRVENESIMIGDEVRVTVIEIQDHAVRLGITDPNHIPPYWEKTILAETDAPTSTEVHEYQFS